MISSSEFGKIAKQYYSNNYDGDSTKIPTELEPGTKVLVVSVHSVNHFSGKLYTDRKIADVNTGAMVKILHEMTNCSTVINNFRDETINPYLGDTNADKFIQKLRNTYKDLIVLDIHGAKDNELFDLAIGTSTLPNEHQLKLIEIINQTAQTFDLKIAINVEGYSAKGRQTITCRAINSGLFASLQIEIVRKYRDEFQMKNMNHMLDFLVTLIHQFEAMSH